MPAKAKRRVLFSLFDQENALAYAKQLVALQWEIIASKETFDLLKENNIAVKDISDFLEIKDKYPFPPTLHPFIELTLTTNHKKSIDFVYITNYPLSKGNDVGGHTILGLAAKGKRIVVFNKEDMARVVHELSNNNNEISQSLCQELIDKAYAKIAQHYMSLLKDYKNEEMIQVIIGKKAMSLLEGENPYQVPSDLFQTDSEDALRLSNFKQVSGVLPCYTNMADFDSILQILCLLTEAFSKYYKKAPFIVIAAKHGNPCGLAVDWNSPEIAIENALFGNAPAIFGGEIITNFPINKNYAEMLMLSKKRESLLGSAQWSLDLIVAPNFDQEAVKILEKRQRLKLFKNENLTQPYASKLNWSYRMVRGGVLRQPPHNYILDIKENNPESALPDSNYLDSLIIAWGTAWNSNHGGNEVAIAKNRMLLSAGGGPATIDACCSAINRAIKCGHNLRDSVFAADAFFPFTDAPEELMRVGCIYGIVPQGGKYFELVKSYFKKHNITVFYLPEQFRGFCRH